MGHLAVQWKDKRYFNSDQNESVVIKQESRQRLNLFIPLCNVS